MVKPKKVLNLYAGIGGNRKLWTDVEVTAVELNPEIAKIYQDFFPDDKVIVADAHQYLLDHYNDGWDFIWSSPPCPTHSRMRFLKMEQNAKDVYPDMMLYQEILYLKTWFEGQHCVENVISYYEPLITPYKSNNHYFWTNFHITEYKPTKRGLIRTTTDERIDYMENDLGFDLSGLEITKSLKSKVLSNCVHPELGLHIFNMAFKHKQSTLFSGEPPGAPE
jgi:DNA (cytosine-5)-methyltransferase 1